MNISGSKQVNQLAEIGSSNDSFKDVFSELPHTIKSIVVGFGVSFIPIGLPLLQRFLDKFCFGFLLYLRTEAFSKLFALCRLQYS